MWDCFFIKCMKYGRVHEPIRRRRKVGLLMDAASEVKSVTSYLMIYKTGIEIGILTIETGNEICKTHIEIGTTIIM